MIVEKVIFSPDAHVLSIVSVGDIDMIVNSRTIDYSFKIGWDLKKVFIMCPTRDMLSTNGFKITGSSASLCDCVPTSQLGSYVSGFCFCFVF